MTDEVLIAPAADIMAALLTERLARSMLRDGEATLREAMERAAQAAEPPTAWEAAAYPAAWTDECRLAAWQRACARAVIAGEALDRDRARLAWVLARDAAEVATAAEARGGGAEIQQGGGVMDECQIRTFIDYMVGDRVIGGNADDPAGTPHSPELRAFIVGRLGSLTPDCHYQLLYHEDKAKAFAALLREVADALDPPAQTAEAA